MTGKQKRLRLSAILASLGKSSLGIEMKKSSRGSVMVISGVMSIEALSEECVELASHSGRIFLAGSSLGVSVLENRVVEVYGQITEVHFTYGKA